MEQIDYLCIGHVARDLTPSGQATGGTVAYSSLSAQALGQRVAVVTSTESGFIEEKLDGVSVALVPAETTTTISNLYTPAGRHQIIHHVAEPLTSSDIPQKWRSPRIAHLGPIANEIEPQMIELFHSEVIGLTPQGWHRGWGPDGKVGFVTWPAAAEILPRATAVILSREDIDDQDTWELYRDACSLLVITSGAVGAQVFFQGQQRHFPPPQVEEIDATGVGDIFATAFFVRLLETGGDPWEAARFATVIAAPTVGRSGLAGIPTLAEVKAARESS